MATKKTRYCPRVKGLLTSSDFGEGFIAVARKRCKQWSCPFCASKNAEIWRAHLLHTFCEKLTDKRWVFVTLTADPKDHVSPAASLKALKAGWSKIYDALRYEYGRKFSYVIVYEQHKSKRYHIHIMIDLGTEYDALGTAPDASKYEDRGALIRAERRHPFCKRLKDMSVKFGLGYIVHARRIMEGAAGTDNARLAVGYVTKYFIKQADIINFPKHAHRIGVSRDIGSPQKANKGMYTWRVRSYIDIYEARLTPHMLLSEGRMLNASDFDETMIYPSANEAD